VLANPDIRIGQLVRFVLVEQCGSPEPPDFAEILALVAYDYID
jgi:hypothetical protein